MPQFKINSDMLPKQVNSIKGDLMKKTMSVANFFRNFADWALKTNTHIYIKDIQKNSIKREKKSPSMILILF